MSRLRAAVAAVPLCLSTQTAITGTSVPESRYDEIMAKPTASDSGRNSERTGSAMMYAGMNTDRMHNRASKRGTARPGETQFALPIRVKVSSRGNVREGPGTNFGVVYAVDSGNMLIGYSYVEDWVRVADDQGRSGWIFRSLLTRP